jgi:hypothetical protein
VQLVDTAGWKKATAMQPTQGPTVASRSSSSNSSSSSSSSSSQLGRQPPSGGATGSADASAAAAAAADGRLLGKQLADASLAQARRALSACHVAVLLLDAPRLMVTEQVRRVLSPDAQWFPCYSCSGMRP